jgi:hypothetical protein
MRDLLGDGRVRREVLSDRPEECPETWELAPSPDSVEWTDEVGDEWTPAVEGVVAGVMGVSRGVMPWADGDDWTSFSTSGQEGASGSGSLLFVYCTSNISVSSAKVQRRRF